MFVFRHPHREHLVAFVCQSSLLITPGRAEMFPVGTVVASQARQSLAGFQGAAEPVT
ncbi:hypothetical protein JS565_25530 [Salmonella enterica subsp. enterica serovar Senftenberg]|nr:hypothetical protein [Salmonella enterica subsp. enterica serovar Senftenberg]